MMGIQMDCWEINSSDDISSKHSVNVDIFCQ